MEVLKRFCVGGFRKEGEGQNDSQRRHGRKEERERDYSAFGIAYTFDFIWMQGNQYRLT